MSHENAIAELRRHAGTQFDPELVELFCDLYANVAPEPDATVAAMTAASTVHAHPHEPAPLVVPEPRPSRVERRRRKTDSPPEPTIVPAPEPAGGDAEALANESTTLAAEGAIGLVEPRDAIPVAKAAAVPTSSTRRRGSAAG